MSNLFELTRETRELEALLDEFKPEDPLVAAKIDELLVDARGRLSTKFDGYVDLIMDLRYRADIRRAEAKRLSEKARIDEAKADRLAQRMKEVMQTFEVLKVETPRFTVAVRKNGGQIPVSLRPGIKPEQLPDCFRKIEYSPDMEAIRNALKVATEESEIQKFAVTGERGTHVSIG